jgi:site-specific DNA-methyltransferase (adenine-specific)
VPSRTVRRLKIQDNLEALSSIPAESVGLVYMDPPFQSGRTYDLVDAARSGEGGGRIAAFDDQWSRNRVDAGSTVEMPEPVGRLVRLLAQLGQRDTAAYVGWMAPRLVELHRVLKSTGSLYLHCDSSAVHHLRVLMDAIFGAANFRNEIVWKRTHAHSGSRRYGPVHDSILFYSKSAAYHWTPQHTAYPAEYLDRYYTHEDERGRYQLITCTAPGDRSGTRAHYLWKGKLPPPGRHWAWKIETMEELDRKGDLAHSVNGVPRRKRYTDEAPGVQLQDVWLDINRLDAHSEERVGFETQKPIALLARIIEASSKEGDLVLDPFVGSGTTLVAAELAKRGWIGIDASLLAGSLSLARVRQSVKLSRIELSGFPRDVAAARSLRKAEPIAFGLWGTSMLATLADRAGRSDSFVIGDGLMRFQRRATQIKSWVPLQSAAKPELDSFPKGRLSKAGFVLRSDRRVGAGLSTHLQKTLGVPIQEVPLESLVSDECLKRGVAPQVMALGER